MAAADFRATTPDQLRLMISHLDEHHYTPDHISLYLNWATADITPSATADDVLWHMNEARTRWHVPAGSNQKQSK